MYTISYTKLLPESREGPRYRNAIANKIYMSREGAMSDATTYSLNDPFYNYIAVERRDSISQRDLRNL